MFQQFSVDHFTITLFLGLLALAAMFDVREYRIPNRISIAIVSLYPVHVLASAAPVDWMGAAIVASIVLAVGVAIFALQVMGGGDVKLLAATALWAGPAGAFSFLSLTALAGGVMALLMLSPMRWSLALALDAAGEKGARDAVLNDIMPYGAAIAIGGYYVGARLLGG